MAVSLIAAVLASSLTVASARASGVDPVAVRLAAALSLPDAATDDGRLIALALEKLASTPTGRPLAQRFAAEGLRAGVIVASIGSGVKYSAGAGYVGQFGSTDPTQDPMVVGINSDWLSWARAQGWSTDRLARAVAGVLGHELLGHALEGSLARRKGLLDAYGLYDGNELGASLSGWLVADDLGLEEEPLMRDYLASPEALRRDIETRGEFYATAIPLSDLRSGATREYAERKERLKTARANDVDYGERNAFLLQIIEHFSSAHSAGDPLHRDAAAMSLIKKDCEASRDSYLPARKKLLGGLERAYDRAESRLADAPRGREFARQAGDPAFDEWERENSARDAELRRRFATRAAPAKPAVRAGSAGGVTMDELVTLYKRDVSENPGHWP